MSKRNTRHLHKFYDADEAGPVEAPMARRRRMSEKADGVGITMEVERSNTAKHLERAAKRLKSMPADQRVLKVPQWNMGKAASAMRKAGVSGVVSNLSGTRKQRVSGKPRQGFHS